MTDNINDILFKLDIAHRCEQTSGTSGQRTLFGDAAALIRKLSAPPAPEPRPPEYLDEHGKARCEICDMVLPEHKFDCDLGEGHAG